MQKIYSSSSIFGQPRQQIDIELNMSAGRKLTEDEFQIVGDKCREIASIIRMNTVLSDPDHIHDANAERENLLLLFAGTAIYVTEVKNEYGGINPWFKVITHKGAIVVGWRKRVINIDWSGSDIEKTGDELFKVKGEDTTIGKDYIHAWGYEKANEYIETLLTS